ncbi:MAG TPA: TonB C-terminal domain-containing protein, partial [Polyangiaceae bacterium]|nr:TonB C-terminal domain-containing protein [Polyangiaceae bacterium]
TDQNDKKPTPGAAPSGPKDDPGNAEETHVRQDMDQPGLRAVAPGGTHDATAMRATASTPAPKQGEAGASAPGAPGSQVAKPPAPAPNESQERNQVAKAATPENLGSPEVIANADGSFTVKRPEAATPEQRAQKAQKRLPPRRPRSILEALGLGAAGRTANGVALNLTPNMATEAVGSNEMSRLVRADGERRRSQHRGSWAVPSFERYRSAIENYVPSVKPGNQTALNTAAVPFATYLTQIHNRIHPIFADTFLSSLDNLPASNPMNDRNLITSLEIVVDHEEGRVVRRGVTRTSGVTAFDINALAAVDRAAPFGTPPSEIVSPDGNVYLHWEFRRDEMACSTLFAHPYILKVQPKPAPLPGTQPLPPFRGPDDETPPSGERHGLLTDPPRPAHVAPPG